MEQSTACSMFIGSSSKSWRTTLTTTKIRSRAIVPITSMQLRYSYFFSHFLYRHNVAQVEPEGEGEGEAEPEDFSELDLDPAKLQLEIPDTAPCGKTLSLPHLSVVIEACKKEPIWKCITCKVVICDTHAVKIPDQPDARACQFTHLPASAIYQTTPQ